MPGCCCAAGRMIMGDTTFNRMYGDTTGETTLRQHAAVAGAEEGVSPQLARGPEGEDVDDILLSPEPSKQQQQQGAAAAGRQAAGQAPNWQAPAFLPPYMQHNNQTATLVRIHNWLVTCLCHGDRAKSMLSFRMKCQSLLLAKVTLLLATPAIPAYLSKLLAGCRITRHWCRAPLTATAPWRHGG